MRVILWNVLALGLLFGCTEQIQPLQTEMNAIVSGDAVRVQDTFMQDWRLDSRRGKFVQIPTVQQGSVARGILLSQQGDASWVVDLGARRVVRVASASVMPLRQQAVHNYGADTYSCPGSGLAVRNGVPVVQAVARSAQHDASVLFRPTGYVASQQGNQVLLQSAACVKDSYPRVNEQAVYPPPHHTSATPSLLFELHQYGVADSNPLNLGHLPASAQLVQQGFSNDVLRWDPLLPSRYASADVFPNLVALKPADTLIEESLIRPRTISHAVLAALAADGPSYSNLYGSVQGLEQWVKQHIMMSGANEQHGVYFWGSSMAADVLGDWFPDSTEFQPVRNLVANYEHPSSSGWNVEFATHAFFVGDIEVIMAEIRYDRYASAYASLLAPEILDHALWFRVLANHDGNSAHSILSNSAYDRFPPMQVEGELIDSGPYEKWAVAMHARTLLFLFLQQPEILEEYVYRFAQSLRAIDRLSNTLKGTAAAALAEPVRLYWLREITRQAARSFWPWDTTPLYFFVDYYPEPLPMQFQALRSALQQTTELLAPYTNELNMEAWGYEALAAKLARENRFTFNGEHDVPVSAPLKWYWDLYH